MELNSHASLDRKEGIILAMLREMGERVDRAMEESVKALHSGDRETAKSVISADDALDALRQRIEEEVFSSIVRFQPVASDLRELVADAYVAAELERVGDYAVGLARMVLADQNALPAELEGDFERLFLQTASMVNRALDAYLTSSDKDARIVAAEDRSIDDIESGLKLKCRSQLLQGGESAVAHANAMIVAHIFERIGDRATNIAERAVFHANGRYVNLNDR